MVLLLLGLLPPCCTYNKLDVKKKKGEERRSSIIDRAKKKSVNTMIKMHQQPKHSKAKQSNQAEQSRAKAHYSNCLLYTSDAADE